MNRTILALWLSTAALVAGPYPGTGPYPLPYALLPPGNTFGPATALPQQIWFVATNGNDSTAVLNRPDLPMLTVSNAVFVATNNQIIDIGYGTFADFTNLSPKTYVTLRGQGPTNTFLKTLFTQANGGQGRLWITLTNGVNVANLCLGHNDATLDSNATLMYPTGVDADPGNTGLGYCVDWTLYNCEIDGVTDCIFILSGYAQGRAINCKLRSHWDTFNVNAGATVYGVDLDFYNIDSISDCNPLRHGGAYPLGDANGIRCEGAMTRVNVYGGSIVVTNGGALPGSSACLRIALGGHLWVSGGVVLANGTNNVANGFPSANATVTNALVYITGSSSVFASSLWPYPSGTITNANWSGAVGLATVAGAYDPGTTNNYFLGAHLQVAADGTRFWGQLTNQQPITVGGGPPYGVIVSNAAIANNSSAWLGTNNLYITNANTGDLVIITNQFLCVSNAINNSATFVGSKGVTNTAGAQFNYMNLQWSTNASYGGIQSNGTANSTLTLKGFEQFVMSMGNTIVQLGDATTNLGHSVRIMCGSTGTNAITTVSSQKISGVTKWTNTVIYSVTELTSDGANWQISGLRGQ